MGAAKSIVHLLHEVAAKAKEILRESVHCQKPLALRGGSKTAPMILLLPSVDVGLCPGYSPKPD
jgi:hypothetical protein